MLDTTNLYKPAASTYTAHRLYYGWVILYIAALAMVGTLPGRTQGLGLITEPLMRDLHISRIAYANINMGATLIGALFCIGIGQMQDKIGSRPVLAAISVALGFVVVTMSHALNLVLLFVLITLTRGLGQSALSVVSLTMVGQWFRKRLNMAMAIYTVVMSLGFMIAFPVVGALVLRSGWRFAWSGIGWFLVVVLAPLAVLFVRRSPESIGLSFEGETQHADAAPLTGFTLNQALSTGAFWVMAIASAMYGLIASGISLFNESVLQERGFDPSIYHQTLVVTALTALVGNFLGGYLAAKGSMGRLMSVAMLLLMVGLAALPVVRYVWQIMVVAVLMGIAGGFVMVLFFSFWGRAYGRLHLGKIQGAAQTMTVVASAIGPWLLAECIKATGSYASAFYILALVVGALALAAWNLRMPQSPLTPNAQPLTPNTLY